jgi:hypothetical protein
MKIRVKFIYHTAARLLRITFSDPCIGPGRDIPSVSPLRVQDYLMSALKSGHDVDYLALP